MEEINLLNDDRFEEMNLDDFAIYNVQPTCMIKTFMEDLAGRKKTYRPFKANTYYEFVEDEQLIDQHEVILMYMVCTLNLTSKYYY